MFTFVYSNWPMMRGKAPTPGYWWLKRLINKLHLGRGGGQVVSVLGLYSDDSSSNPAEAYSFFCNIVFENNENKQKRGRDWPTFKKQVAAEVKNSGRYRLDIQ